MAVKARSDVITLVRVNDGKKGDTGISVTSTVDEWYLSTSSTILSGGSWSSTRQAWASGKYYWRRIKTTYSDGSTSYTPSNSGYYDAAMTDSVAKANNAYSIADGKNAIYYSDTEPAGNDYAVNDVWFDTKNDNVMYYWDGSRWVQKQFGTTAVKDGAILADKLAVNSVTSDKVLAGAINGDKIAANAVSADSIQSNAITSDKIKADAITSDKILAGAIKSDKIYAGAVTASKILVDSVLANKIFAQDITATGTITGATLKGISVEGSYANFGSAIFFRLPKNQNVWANALWTNIEEDSPTANKIMLGMDFDQVAIAAWTSLQSGLTVAGTSEFKLASTFQNTVNLNGNLVTNSTINGNKYQYVTTESKTGLNLSIAANGYKNISGYLPTKSGYTLASYSVRCTGTNGVYVVHPGMGSPYILNTYNSAVTVTALNFTCVWTKT